MRGIQGTVNDGVYCNLTINYTGPDDWTSTKALLKNRNQTHLGQFQSLNSEVETSGKVYVNYTDFTTKIQVILEEDATCPKIRVSCPLANPDKYNVSSFFVVGHFKVIAVNVISAERTFTGDQLNDPLKLRKDIKLLDKLMFTWENDPKITLKETATPFGNIVSVTAKTYLEI